MSGIQLYDFNLSAGGPQYLPASGAFYRVIASTGPVSIKESGGGTVGPISAGQGMRNRDFVSLVITDASGAPNKGTLIVADSDFVDDRITGEVSTIDGGKARSLAGNAFGGYGYQAGGAGVQSQVQAWNKAGSGKNIILNELTVLSSAATGVQLGLTNAPFGTWLGVGRTKRAGGVDSAAVEIRANSGAWGGAVMRTFGIQASTSASYRPTEPLVIPPGFGLVACTTNANVDLGLSFDWWEELA